MFQHRVWNPQYYIHCLMQMDWIRKKNFWFLKPKISLNEKWKKSNEFRSSQQIVNWWWRWSTELLLLLFIIHNIDLFHFISFIGRHRNFLHLQTLANVKERDDWTLFLSFFIWQSKWIESNWNDIDTHIQKTAAEWKPNCVGGKSEEEKKFCFFWLKMYRSKLAVEENLNQKKKKYVVDCAVKGGVKEIRILEREREKEMKLHLWRIKNEKEMEKNVAAKMMISWPFSLCVSVCEADWCPQMMEMMSFENDIGNTK